MIGSAKIMMVEDDENLGFLVKDYLGSFGCSVSVYSDGEKGLSAFRSNSFDLCILDVMLPSRDGIDLASEIRKFNQQVPIVFLTAKSQTEDRIRGFRAGADDYICKPFSIEEFRYRIEAVLRRAGESIPRTNAEQQLLRAGDSSLDLSNLILDANGTVTRLTYKEARVLELFFRHTNRLVGRDVFLHTIWENDGFFVARSMDVFVSRVRKYIKDDSRLKIANVRGVGYIMRDRPEDAP